ncbi:hypothetical protein [Jeotgalibacillus proteolyticus]|uniref:Uncharacterized protein n=1 Tax=Jeotgalibacillus proteolyticus TaxID=2082395 RepID=A0A2S5GFW5_9BACL|nr:hypothetical protein [Jeotgalibacillus proteolyticus]PPA71815.1 hypothetical protein C4B60_00090 [Jeotgalibacillus proteolyticus]
MYEDFRFYFDVDKVEKLNDSYVVYVKTRILDHEKFDYFEGVIRVELNPVGIYPKPGDIARAVSPKNLRGKLGSELKRYIKPQRRFLYELA